MLLVVLFLAIVIYLIATDPDLISVVTRFIDGIRSFWVGLDEVKQVLLVLVIVFVCVSIFKAWANSEE